MTPIIISSDSSLSILQTGCTFDLKLPQASPSGFSLSTAPSPSFLFSGNGRTIPLTGTVRISQQSGNVAIMQPDGIFVGLPSFSETLLTVIDTLTMNLTVSGIASHVLKADVNVSATVGNSLIVKSDGLYVPPINGGGTYTDTQARNSLSGALPVVYSASTGVIGINVASGTQAGYLTAAAFNVFNSKEPAITAGTTAQYWRGDKTFQLLNTTVVPEGTNQYFSALRARNSISSIAPIAYNNSTGVVSIPSSTISQDGFLASSDFAIFTTKVNTGVSLASVSAQSIFKDKNGSNNLEIRGIRGGSTGTIIASLQGDDIVLDVVSVLPTVNAGPDQSIVLPTTSVTLSGTATTASGTIVSTTWSFLYGPSSYSITNASSLSSTITGLVAGTYSFRLTAVNSFGLISTDDMIIVVAGSSSSLDTIYVGVSVSGAIPTAGAILAGNSSLQNGALNVNADWTTLSAATPVFCFFAIPDVDSAHEKNKWFIDSLNNGNIGGVSDLFGPLSVVVVGGVNYSVGITNFATQFTSVAQLQKV